MSRLSSSGSSVIQVLRLLLAALVALTGVQSVFAQSDEAVPAAAVDAERLINANAEPENWMTHGRTYDEQRYSPLDRIDRENVEDLGLAWYADMDTSRAQEATPIVVDGKLYVSTSWSHVKAYDVATGEQLWAYDPEVARAKGADACCDVVNRGVAVWDGKVYVGVLDGRLVALDADTGEEEWSVATFDPELKYTITGAPRVIKGKVIIGNGGAEYGVRGYVSAYDAGTGELDWRFHTVPGNPADGFENEVMEAIADTWTGEWWTLGGGGTVWDSIAYDPELDLMYIGVGNGSPWNQALRSPEGGDNLFLSSIVALDPDDGSYVWHYQTTPGETWDFTATQHMILADLEIDEEPRRVLMQAPKNGFFYVLDAATGEFISAENFIDVNWATHINPDTGRPVENPEARYDQTDSGFIVKPGPLGGHNWYPMAHSPDTGLVYIPVTENFAGYFPDLEFVINPNGWNTGNDFARGSALVREADDPPEMMAYLQAWDPVAQEERWRVVHEVPTDGAGVLATAGGLVFQGNRSGEFVAYNDETGERLWSGITQAAVMAPASTFAVDGEQYVALLVGAPSSFGGDSGVPAGFEVTTTMSTNNSRLLVFRLGGDAQLPTEPVVQEEQEGEFVLPQTNASNETIAQGQRAYAQVCSACHGENAVSSRPGVFPDLRMSPYLADLESWESVVLGGELTDQGMVSFEESLQEGDAAAIRAFIIRRANQDPGDQ
ncbi:MAG: PQQ-dependent dehydrogenase, methanol/ethanol family [Pseudohongiellaceae bacterium]